MDVPLYDVYLTGKLADEVTPALAAQRLAALFKSTPEAMTGLITGKAQLLKRGVDKNTALKYRDTLQKAGCEVMFKAQTNAVINESPSVNSQPATNTQPTTHTQPATSTQPTARTQRTTSAQPAMPSQTDISNSATAKTAAHSMAAGLQLAPAGGELLRAEERHPIAAVSVETAHLSLAPVGSLPNMEVIPVAAPDTSYLSLAAAEGNLLNESEREIVAIIAPDISDLSLAEVGAPIETLKNDEPPLNPDTSGLTLTPAGTDLLTSAERHHPQPAAPKTDHITLAP